MLYPADLKLKMEGLEENAKLNDEDKKTLEKKEYSSSEIFDLKE